MSKKLQIRNSTAEFLIFQLESKEQGIEVLYQDETLWLTQEAIAILFDKSRSTITEHLQNIFQTQELQEDSACRKFRRTATDGKSYAVKYYNLDAVISVGYRANSVRATQFRQWCTDVLRQFAIRGYVVDKKRMENGTFINEDYFEHLLAEVREIRLSKRRFYQKLTDIYATSIDYNKDALCYSRAYGCGADCRACRCRERIYGTYNLGESTRWEDYQNRCFNCQELPQRK